MTNEPTHTPYQRGRRAAERGAPRDVPGDILGVMVLTYPPQFPGEEWLKGFDSVPKMDACMGILESEPTPASMVNHPHHYNAHPSGIECIQVAEHMSFNLGNAMKYIWRADEKGNAMEDLKKAEWYIKREIARREAA